MCKKLGKKVLPIIMATMLVASMGAVGASAVETATEESTVVAQATGEVTTTGLPESNVIYYELENNAWCCVRPSGTEPKIKYYFGVKGDSLEDAAEKLETLKKGLVK